MDSNVERFLSDAARMARTTPDAILRAVFHTGKEEEKTLRQHFPQWEPRVFELLLDLDYAVRTRNPGLHYVDRGTYLGYRREAHPEEGKSGRSQVFLSIIKRANVLTAVMPLEPSRFRTVKEVRDLTGRGHHGVGELEFTIPDADALTKFLRVFDRWLMGNAFKTYH